MTEQTKTEHKPVEKTELDVLKEQATTLGIEFKANVTVKGLKKLIADKLNDDLQADANQERFSLEDENLKLVRVIITPNDPIKRDLKGEYFSTGNSVLGTIKKFIPFGIEWLVPNILVKNIEEREYQYMQTTENKLGVGTIQSRFLPAYQVIKLPLPTKEEIEELAKAQAVSKV